MNINKKKDYVPGKIGNNQVYLSKEIEKRKNDPTYICINCFFYTFYIKIEDFEKYKITPREK